MIPRTIAKAAAPLLLLLAVPAPGAAPVSPPIVEYRIQARLEPASHTIEGTERLIWRNPSDDAVGEIRLHLYLNAFKNSRSTFLRESGGLVRELTGDRPEQWGWIDVLSIRDPQGGQLRASARFVQPDGNDASDQTVLSVPLASPVSPRGSIELAIEFRAKLPRILARTGFVRDFHFAGQWFPKIGVYEPSGTRGRPRGGWSCHAFHATSEFYADFGIYDVAVTVPSSYVVGATGSLVSESASPGGRTTYRYVARDVHDFAWTADPRFRLHEFRFEPARDVPSSWTTLASRELGVPASQLALRSFRVRLLLQPEHAAALDRYVRSTKQAIAFYGLWFGAYPYETLTVVDPPEDGLTAGGMEYPTLITGLAPRLLLSWPFERVRLVEDVAIHEFGHQYWYGMVASNEFEESWLDEGVNTDSEYRAMELAYGSRAIQLPGGIGLGLPDLAHLEYRTLPNLDPIRRFAWRFSSWRSYGVNSYSKVGLLLAQMRNDLGAETFARAERSYFERWSFRHPTTSDFFDVFQRVSGRDLSTYRDNLLEGTARLDWSVISASASDEAPEVGVFDRPGGRVTIEKPKARSPSKAAFVSRVLLGNLGEWPHAASVRLAFQDGRVVDRQLSSAAHWVRWTIRYGSPLSWVAIDPDRRNAWEWSRSNDSRVVGNGRGAARTRGRAAALRSLGWTAYLIGLFTELLGALA